MLAVLINNHKIGAEKLYIGEFETPEPDNGQVLVKIYAFGISRMDILQREGQYPVPPGASNILGVEFSGTVVKLGPNPGLWAVGDEVLGLSTGGAYAEFIAIGINFILPKPPTMSWVIAAAIMENYITALQALETIAHLKEGETVLIHTGASGVGTAALQLAKALSAEHIFATASSESKLQFLQKLIGDEDIFHPINYKEENFEEKVKEVTGGKGVDILLDFVGRSHWNKNLGSLAVGGRMVLLGLLSGDEVEKTSIRPILYKRLQITGTTLRSLGDEYQTDLIQRFGRGVLNKISRRAFDDQGDGERDHRPIHVVLHGTYPFAHIVQAHQEMETDASIGKIVVNVWNPQNSFQVW